LRVHTSEVFFIKAVVKSRLCVICVRRILVDAGESGNVEYINNLAKVLKQHRTSIQEIVITHWHLDHVGGVPDVCSQIDGCKSYCLCTFFLISFISTAKFSVQYNCVFCVLKINGMVLYCYGRPM